MILLNKHKANILTLLLVSLILSSCVSLQFNKINKETDCLRSKFEIQSRSQLFPELSKHEIARRQKIKLPSVSTLDKDSVVSRIVASIRNASKNSQFIVVDLRYYKDVDLTNIIISNESEFTLIPYLFTSKYSQGFFSLINFNEDAITVSPPEIFKAFNTEKIYRPDLINSEIVINVNNSESIFGNMKFSSNIKFSLLADNIAKPFRLDLREASNMQFNLNRKWIMSVYSLENSTSLHNKITTAFIKYTNNINSNVKISKFYKSNIKCYLDEDNKFNIIQ